MAKARECVLADRLRVIALMLSREDDIEEIEARLKSDGERGLQDLLFEAAAVLDQGVSLVSELDRIHLNRSFAQVGMHPTEEGVK